MASSVRTYIGSFPHVKGLEALEAKISALPQGLAARIQAGLDAQADELVAAMKAIAPTSVLEPHPGELRESIHKGPAAVSLGVSVIADAVDDKGRGYAAHVEYGHKTPEGRHVPAKPFFWPSYQVGKRRFRARMSRIMHDAVAAVRGLGGEPTA